MRKRREVEEFNLEFLYEKVNKLYEEGNLEEAIKRTEEIIKKFPYNIEPYLWLGDLLFETYDLEGALEAYKKAVRLDDKNSDAHSSVAKMYFLLGDFGNADKHTDIALNINPEDGEALYLKALILDRQNNFDLSDQYMKKANLVDPDIYPKPLQVSSGHFEAFANFVFQNLDDKVRSFIKDVEIEICNVPSDDEIKSGIGPLSLSRLIVKKEEKDKKFTIRLYFRNLLHFSESEEELRENINICYLNEINKILNEMERQNESKEG